MDGDDEKCGRSKKLSDKKVDGDTLPSSDNREKIIIHIAKEPDKEKSLKQLEALPQKEQDEIKRMAKQWADAIRNLYDPFWDYEKQKPTREYLPVSKHPLSSEEHFASERNASINEVLSQLDHRVTQMEEVVSVMRCRVDVDEDVMKRTMCGLMDKGRERDEDHKKFMKESQDKINSMLKKGREDLFDLQFDYKGYEDIKVKQQLELMTSQKLEGQRIFLEKRTNSMQIKIAGAEDRLNVKINRLNSIIAAVAAGVLVALVALFFV